MFRLLWMETGGSLGIRARKRQWVMLRKEKLKEVMDWVLDLGVPYFTVYALSTENISERDSEELEILYDLYVSGLDEISVDPRIHDRE